MDWLQYVTTILAFVYIIYRAFFSKQEPIPETSGQVFKIQSAAEFEALLASTTNVVVDFYADWCAPCRAIAPAFSEMADKHSSPGKLAFAKVNVEHIKDVSKRYAVSAMPTFMFFKKGAIYDVPVDDSSVRFRQTVVRGPDGQSIERIQGADKGALQAIVQALAASL